MIVNGGSVDVGVWYALDMSNYEVVKEGESRGQDAHGVWATPDGREIWMVNRVSSNGIVIDAATLEITGELSEVGKTPDIIAMSPDSQRAFITTRGPNPVTAPHLAKGETPGFAVVSIPDRKLIQVVQPAEGNEQSDFLRMRINPSESPTPQRRNHPTSHNFSRNVLGAGRQHFSTTSSRSSSRLAKMIEMRSPIMPAPTITGLPMRDRSRACRAGDGIHLPEGRFRTIGDAGCDPVPGDHR